jgi:hypothetical protein
MTFLSPSVRKHVLVARQSPQNSPLSQILKKRDVFKAKYFEDIDKTRRNLDKLHKKYKEMPMVNIGKWSIRGLMYKDSVLIRASDGHK